MAKAEREKVRATGPQRGEPTGVPRHARPVGRRRRPARAADRRTRGGERRLRRCPLPSGDAVRAVAAFGEGTAATACDAAAAVAGPHYACRSGWATAPRCRRSSTIARSSSRCRPRRHRRHGRGTRGAGPRGAGGGRGERRHAAALAADTGLPWCPVTTDAARRHRRARRRDGSGAGRTGREPAWSPTSPPRSVRRRRPWGAGVTWLTPGGPAQVLARHIGRTIPLVYGADGVGAVAARWWKARVNLNAKAPAFTGRAAAGLLRRAGRLGPGWRRDPPDHVAGPAAPRR